jgi:glutathione synthase
MKKHRKIIAIQGDPLNSLNIKTDTTLLLALEAQKRGYKIYYYETKNLTFSNRKIYSLCKEVVFFEKKKKFYSIKNFKTIDLSKVNFILMRQNPPFNMDYITAVRNMPEKLHSMEFLKLMPATIFTRNIDEIETFIKKHKKIVIKPTHGYGGKNIIFLNKKLKKKKILNYINQHDQVMVQKFLPKIREGDKRIFVIGGVIKGAIKRVPKRGSIISNIGQGGIPKKTTLTKQELKVAKIVSKNLKKNKIVFAGIDLISGYLTGDINITSPTGLKNYKDLTGINLAVNFWNYLEN